MKIYYEADCPFSKGFVANDLGPANSDPSCLEHVHIDWVPYGNAHLEGAHTVCQHGEDECFGNRLHLCAKKKFGADDKGLTKWIVCTMTNLNAAGKQSHDRSVFEPCGGPFTPDELEQCANSREGMLREAGSQTEAAQPKQAPWVVFVGQESYNAQANFLFDVCNQHDTVGLPRPACCPPPDGAALAGQNAWGRRLLV